MYHWMGLLLGILFLANPGFSRESDLERSLDKILLIKRSEKQLGLPNNWEGNSSLPRSGYDNEIALLSDLSTDPKLTTLFRPEDGSFVGDVDLEFDGERLLFSRSDPSGPWRLWEMRIDGDGLHPIPLINEPDVDEYDACYLPDGRIVFSSSAPFIGVPCVTGSSHVANLYLADLAANRMRRLTVEQDHDWCPTVLPNGRVLYLRWEYSDIPHFASRILFHMNPDGTEQMEYYGSNSYWPNSLFFARPCPGSSTRFVGIVSGHHDVPRMGDLVLFDVSRGRQEAAGAIQRIPGHGTPVDPVLADRLVADHWPKFLHPFPLSDEVILVSCKPRPNALWGIYLVEASTDRVTLLYEEPGVALLEPVPLKRTPRPPVVPDRIRPDETFATVFIENLLVGNGLRGVPPGTVKSLRLFTYHFAYHGMGGQVNRVGLDGPWDIKRVLGTVPVEPDGSAYFKIPAMTPISIQPLDQEGKALQLMRSWMTAMPGEVVSCVGCHERQNRASNNRPTLASRRPVSEIQGWYGPVRGFSFKREVQPVLDACCIRCHDGKADRPDLRSFPEVHPQALSQDYNNGTQFTPSYLALKAMVRNPTIESDLHLLMPYEYHANTTRLVRMLKKGHHGVSLDAESWDRLITWIDLNTPAHGTWREIVGDEKVLHQRDRRREMNLRYARIDEDPEAIPISVVLGPSKPRLEDLSVSERAEEGHEQPRRCEKDPPEVLDLGEGVQVQLVQIEPGELRMTDGSSDSGAGSVRNLIVASPFWMARTEITNQQFARFDPSHDSRIETGDFLQFSERERGYPVNRPEQPVCRVSWLDAKAFCLWLSERTGLCVDLPTEIQWEYACRASTLTPLWWGDVAQDFSPYANLADRTLRTVENLDWGLPSGAVPPWRPAVDSVNDGFRVSAPAGHFKPNPWGLCDMHGNVSEWTRTVNAEGAQVVCGGSWNDRPQEAGSGYRWHYPEWQGVFDVGFRIVCEPGPN